MVNNKQIVAKYYEMWNTHNFDIANTILSEDLKFHGSIGIHTTGLEEFKEYATTILSAFPDLYHATEIVVGEGPQVAVYVTYRGTHQGKLLDYEATQNKISYSGASFFVIKDDKITNIHVLGDRYSLYNQIKCAE